jgi:hypothetical protein
MDRSLLVRVFVPTTRKPKPGVVGPDGVTGTAFPVGNGLLLTALHVVRPTDERGNDIRHPALPIEVWWDGADRPAWIPLDPDDRKAIAWTGKDGLDAALLHCECPLGGESRGFISANAPRETLEWVSAGFPYAAKEEEGRHWASFGGKMFATTDKRPIFELDVIGDGPADGLDWRGASGMPICLPDTNLIYGVAVRVPPNYTGKRLHATPTARMCKDPDFVRVLGREDEQRRRVDEFRVHVTKALERSSLASTTLAANPSLAEATRARKIVAGPGSLAEWLLGLEFADAMDSLWWAWQKLLKDQNLHKPEDLSEAFDALSFTVQAIGPALFDAGQAGAVRAHALDDGMMICRLHISTPTVAELIMAAAEGRPADYHPRREDPDIPHGKLSLPLRPPEGGIGSEAESAEILRTTLARKFSPGGWADLRRKIDDHLIAALLGRSLAPEDRDVSLAAIELETVTKYGYRYYMVCVLPTDPGARETIEAGLTALKKDWKALLILGIEEDRQTLLRETKDYGAFRRMLPKEKSA